MTSIEIIKNEINNLEDILENAIKKNLQTIIKQCEEDLKQYNQVLKDLEILDILKEWLVYDEREEAIMTYIDIPLDLMEKLKGWLDDRA